MKHRYLALFISMITSAPAFAAPVIMVQFGSFETQQEAQKRLDDLKSSNGSVINSINPSVREVKLPPDNLTVYRTQAGPLESRTAAQTLCNKLAASGSECYVVETAVSTGTPVAAPAATAAAQPVPSETPEKLGAIAPVALAAAPAVTAPTASPELQTAMNRAAAIQDAGQVSAPVATAPAEKPSFWSRLNPFSSTPAPKPAPKPVVVAEKLPEAAPIPEVTASALPPIAAPAPVAAPAIVAAPVVAPVPAPAPVVTAEAAPIPAAPASVVPQNFRPRFANTNAPASTPAVETAAVAPRTFTPAEPMKPEALTSSTPAAGSVQVEEAKRVPVSSTTPKEFRPRIRELAPYPTASNTVKGGATAATAPAATLIPPAVNPLPSSTTGQRTLWAQVGHFQSTESALDFWDKYRHAHPDFPALRVRVVSSLQQEQHGNEHVWLRVGPFSREAFVTSLCNSLNTTDKRCGQISDLGISAKTSFTQTGYLQGSRYKR